MNRRALLTVLLCAIAATRCASCRSIDLHLAFDVPEPYRSRITEFEVRLISPPGPDSGIGLDCDAIAFGGAGPEVIAVRQDMSWTFTPDASFSLGDVPRAANKLFWVDGLGVDRQRLVTGCSEVGELLGSTDVVISGEPVVTVAVTPVSLEFEAATAATSLPLNVSFTDALGRSVMPPVQLRWVVNDVNGQLFFGVADGGVVNVPRPPEHGPFGLGVAARWAQPSVVIVPGMYAPEGRRWPAATGPMPSLAGLRAGRFLADGGAAVAALLDDGSQRTVVLLTADATDLAPRMVWPSIDAGLLVRVPAGRADRLIAAAGNELYELVEGVPQTTHLGSLALSAPYSAIHPLDFDCDGSAELLLMVQSDGTVPRRLAAPGMSLGSVPGRVLGAGCLSTADGGALATLVIDDPIGRALYAPALDDADAGKQLRARWWGVGEALAYGGEPRQLVGVEAVGEAFSLVRARAVHGPGGLGIERIGTFDPLITPPVALVVADFRGKRALDVAAVLGFPSDDPQRPAFAGFVALQGEGQQRVSGGLGLGKFTCPPLIDTADLYGGPGDELIIGLPCHDVGTPLIRTFGF